MLTPAELQHKREHKALLRRTTCRRRDLCRRVNPPVADTIDIKPLPVEAPAHPVVVKSPSRISGLFRRIFTRRKV